MKEMMQEVYLKHIQNYQSSGNNTPMDALRQVLIEEFDPEKADASTLIAVCEIFGTEGNVMACWYAAKHAVLPPRAHYIAAIIGDHTSAFVFQDGIDNTDFVTRADRMTEQELKHLYEQVKN